MSRVMNDKTKLSLSFQERNLNVGLPKNHFDIKSRVLDQDNMKKQKNIEMYNCMITRVFLLFEI